MSIQAKPSKIKWIIVAICAVVLAGGAVFAFSIPGIGKVEKVKAVNGTVTVPVSQLADGKAHYYRFEDGGKEIKFFAVKGSDGAVHTAFDACDVCYREKKGYEQQGEFMVCQNCNRKFGINRIGGAGGGGCNPSYLSSSRDRNRIVIKAADLQTGAKFF